jgi:hypothetical protein
MDGNASRICAHCLTVLSKHDVGDQAVRMERSSMAGHEAVCPIPFRQPLKPQRKTA